MSTALDHSSQYPTQHLTATQREGVRETDAQREVEAGMRETGIGIEREMEGIEGVVVTNGTPPTPPLPLPLFLLPLHIPTPPRIGTPLL